MPVLETIVAVVEKAGTVAAETSKKGVETVKNISETGVRETAKNQVENIKSAGEAVLTKIDEIKNLTPEQLREKIEEYIKQENPENTKDASESKEGKEGLSDEQKEKIKEEMGWSDEIIDAIGSMEEYEIYKKAGLLEAEIGDKKCLIRTDIDWEQKDAMGRTNKERAEQGLSPINKDGKVIELHHIGQHADSPLAELIPEEHRGKGNDKILHDKTKESEIDRQTFAGERNLHWEARANEGGNQQ